jgi:hypothetical protein
MTEMKIDKNAELIELFNSNRMGMSNGIYGMANAVCESQRLGDEYFSEFCSEIDISPTSRYISELLDIGHGGHFVEKGSC